MADANPEVNGTHTGGAAEVMRAFVPLGFTAFGGPVAHLGYFRTAFVERRGWMTDAEYADLVALCQFMPGPASSQVGMAIGLSRGGPLGMAAAWVAFTLPSAILLAAFGLFLTSFDIGSDAGWLLGLKAAAAAVVLHALLGMAGSLAATRERATIAVVAMIAMLVVPNAVIAQLGVIVLGGLAGLAINADVPKAVAPAPTLVSKPVGIIALALFFIILFAVPLIAQVGPAAELFGATYRAGSLVFGGGHVVLPLLQAEMGTMVNEGDFLAGYGAAQAVPGPLFTFSAFLGAVAQPFGGVVGAIVALIGIFLPSALLVLGVMPFWEGLRQRTRVRQALAGVNAAVVGLLAAALYNPVFVDGVRSAMALAVAAAAFIVISQWKAPPWAVVIAAAAAGAVLL